MAGASDFSFVHIVETGSNAHPSSCPIGARVSFPRAKVAGSLIELSLLSSAEVKNTWSCMSTLPDVFMV
jgi:hypothetical protein